MAAALSNLVAPPLPAPPIGPAMPISLSLPSAQAAIEGSFLSEESLPNPMKPWDVSPSLALCPANFAKRANLKKGLEKDKKRGKIHIKNI